MTETAQHGREQKISKTPNLAPVAKFNGNILRDIFSLQTPDRTAAVSSTRTVEFCLPSDGIKRQHYAHLNVPSTLPFTTTPRHTLAAPPPPIPPPQNQSYSRPPLSSS